MPKNKETRTNIRPRLRIMSGKNIAFGPGKADLLDAIEQSGSITKAASKLDMSYMRAWNLIRVMNRCFRQPLVEAERGGTRGGGGARLTATGREVLALYRQMEKESQRAIELFWHKLQKLLRA
jgi:molybdate transport system regulatory protein